MTKNQSLRANISTTEKQELDAVATVLDIPTSQIIREAVREKVAKLRKTHPKLKESAEVETA